MKNAILPSLKILHVGDFFHSLKKRSVSQLSVGGKLSNGLIRNGHHVINFSYRDISRAKGFFNSHYLGRHAMWRALKNSIKSFSPDILILGHGYSIPPEIITDVKDKNPGIIIIQWNIDALFVEQNLKNIKERHQVVDASFISTAGKQLRLLLGDRGIIGFLPNPVDMSVERGRNFSVNALPYDIFYSCGNPDRLRDICGKKWQMDDFCSALEKELPQKTKFAYAGVKGHPYKSGVSYTHLLENSAIGLNISRKADHYLYSSDRLAHMIGNGQLVAIERQVGYDQIFSDDEMIFFNSFDELIDKLKFYTNHTEVRQKCARKGWEHYSQIFNERNVADYMIRETLGLLRDDEYLWRCKTFIN
ncbi:glycosyltransferase [Aristophania vespae]|uniref:glycosyltransferase n=1 Tax=Aristophania vespae TaxID=2697033 RepID=UPI002351C123|nr:glycosyltransferase [Aristophania vespae]UMM63470.1 hypothetical protein DM15PD_04370 [Aristophania vespae]